MPTLYLPNKLATDSKIAELEGKGFVVYLFYQAMDGSWVMVYFEKSRL
jgi:hypothetical protein